MTTDGFEYENQMRRVTPLSGYAGSLTIEIDKLLISCWTSPKPEPKTVYRFVNGKLVKGIRK